MVYIYTYFSKIYSKITLTKFQLAINIAADQLFMKSKISPAVKGATAIVVKSIVLKTALILANLQGRGNSFYSGGARIIGKIRFWQFSKNLLHKSWILGGGPGSPRPPPGPTPLLINVFKAWILTTNTMKILSKNF